MPKERKSRAALKRKLDADKTDSGKCAKTGTANISNRDANKTETSEQEQKEQNRNSKNGNRIKHDIISAKALEIESLGNLLKCSICQDFYHDAVSLQPCMHSFCGGCYSVWMKKKPRCPECRGNVTRIHCNFRLNSLVNCYYSIKPELKRSEKELSALNKKNTITRDMQFPTTKINEDETDSDEEETEETILENGNFEIDNPLAARVDGSFYADNMAHMTLMDIREQFDYYLMNDMAHLADSVDGQNGSAHTILMAMNELLHNYLENSNQGPSDEIVEPLEHTDTSSVSDMLLYSLLDEPQ